MLPSHIITTGSCSPLLQVPFHWIIRTFILGIDEAKRAEDDFHSTLVAGHALIRCGDFEKRGFGATLLVSSLALILGDILLVRVPD